MSVPTFGDEYSQLMEHLRRCEEHAAMIAHLHNANDNRGLAIAWLQVSENFKKTQHTLTKLAMGKLN